MSNISIHNLSLTISELIDLDSEQQSEIELAVNRATFAKKITGGARCYGSGSSFVVGAIAQEFPSATELYVELGI